MTGREEQILLCEVLREVNVNSKRARDTSTKDKEKRIEVKRPLARRNGKAKKQTWGICTAHHQPRALRSDPS